MGRFVNGVLIGVGIGLLIALMWGEEMQRLMRERYQQIRSNLPEKEQVAATLSQTASTLKGAAQQTAQKARQTGQDALSATKQAAQSVKERGQTDAEGSETVILFENDMDL